MKLYHDPRARSVRPWVLLEELNVPYELVPVSLERQEQKTEAHRRLHPLGQLPVLVDEDRVLFESVAICLYLADHYGSHATLAPAPGSAERGRYYQWCVFVPGSLEPALYRAHLERTGGAVPPGFPSVPDVLGALATALRLQGFLLSSGYSAADVLVGCTLIQSARMGLELPGALTDYVARLRARPAFATAFGAPASAER